MILKQLEPQQILTKQRVCKLWRDIINGSLTLQGKLFYISLNRDDELHMAPFDLCYRLYSPEMSDLRVKHHLPEELNKNDCFCFRETCKEPVVHEFNPMFQTIFPHVVIGCEWGEKFESDPEASHLAGERSWNEMCLTEEPSTMVVV
jgi:hypothetical protein